MNVQGTNTTQGTELEGPKTLRNHMYVVNVVVKVNHSYHGNLQKDVASLQFECHLDQSLPRPLRWFG